jgi:hypothetical protein
MAIPDRKIEHVALELSDVDAEVARARAEFSGTVRGSSF